MTTKENILTGDIVITEDQYPAIYKDSGLQKYLDKIKVEVKAESESIDLDPNTEK